MVIKDIYQAAQVEIFRTEIAKPWAFDTWAQDAIDFSMMEYEMLMRAEVGMQHCELQEDEFVENIEMPEEDQIPKPPIDNFATHKVPVKYRKMPNPDESSIGDKTNRSG